MPIAKIKKFDAWSMSRLNDWRKCPAYAKFKHLDKLKEPPAPAMDRGKTIHETAAKAVSEPLDAAMPEALARFNDEFQELRACAAEAKQSELQWGFTSAWKNVGFFGAAVWVRMILDLRWTKTPEHTAIIDYKTGKVYEKNREQNKLYAVGEFMSNPDAERVDTALWYLDEGIVVEDTYLRKDVPALIAYWDKESRGMMQDIEFSPTPGSACRFCSFAKSKGGPCSAAE